VAACERGWAGVFCMATDPAVRRRGVARAVMGALASWSREAGAEGMYLQVERDKRRGARAVRVDRLRVVARLSLPRGPARRIGSPSWDSKN
jgi:GNAT superfamily N-acetyltransferase